MLPFSNDTVTLYHKHKYTDEYNKVKTEWQRHILPGCYWGGKAIRISIGDISISSDDTVVKIPSEYDIKITVGDIIVNGSVSDESPPTNGITVKSVKNNGGCRRLGHISITGA